MTEKIDPKIKSKENVLVFMEHMAKEFPLFSDSLAICLHKHSKPNEPPGPTLSNQT